MNTEQDILRYIPQRAPFTMVDELKTITENGLESGFTIKPDNYLVDNGFFQESGLIENMAQTAAMYAGYLASESNKPAPVGYIGALKSLRIETLPLVNERLTTSIALKSEVMNIQIVEAKVRNHAKKVIAECELRIFLKQD